LCYKIALNRAIAIFFYRKVYRDFTNAFTIVQAERVTRC